jgi:hypothetical protein
MLWACTLSKACQHTIIEYNVVHGLNYASIKVVQIDIHKCIIWPVVFVKVGKYGTKFA